MTIFTISFIVYTGIIVLIGAASLLRRTDDSNTEFFLAGRKLGPWVASLSASASSESGWVTLGLVGWAFTAGVSAYWIIPGCLLGFIFNWFVLARPLRERAHDLDADTLPDLFALHFRERTPALRLLSVVVILTAMMLYVAAQFAAAGEAFQVAFGANRTLGVCIGAAIVLTYCAIGGFRAACWTDFAQALVMVGTLVIFPLWLITAGPSGDLLATLENHDPALVRFTPDKAGVALIGFLVGSSSLGINLGYPGQPHVLVRFMALRRNKDAIVGGFIAVVWATAVYWGAVTVGLAVRAMTIRDADWTGPLAEQLAAGASNAGETGLILGAMNMIPGVLAGMVLAAILAAICSTADSQLMVAASAAANDVYGRLFDRDGRDNNLWINRVTVVLVGVVAVGLALDDTISVYEYVLTYGWAILGAAFGPQLILLLFFRRASYAGCLAGMATGFGVALGWKLWADNGVTINGEAVEIYNLTLAFVAAFVVNVVVSLATPPPTPPASSSARG